MREDKDLRHLFEITDRKLIVNEEKKYQILEVLSDEMKERKVHSIDSRIQIMKSQFYYMEKKLWVTDLAVNIAFILLCGILAYCQAAVNDMLLFSMASASVLGGVSIIVLADSFKNGITELADTCYFSMQQLAGMKLMILGAVNLVTLTSAAFYVSVQWQMWIFRVVGYMGVPFLFTVAVCLGVLVTEKGRKKRHYLMMIAGVFSLMIVLTFSAIPDVYLLSSAVIWSVGVTAGAGLLMIQVKRLFTAINKGEILCIN